MIGDYVVVFTGVASLMSCSVNWFQSLIHFIRNMGARDLGCSHGMECIGNETVSPQTQPYCRLCGAHCRTTGIPCQGPGNGRGGRCKMNGGECTGRGPDW